MTNDLSTRRGDVAGTKRLASISLAIAHRTALEFFGAPGVLGVHWRASGPRRADLAGLSMGVAAPPAYMGLMGPMGMGKPR